MAAGTPTVFPIGTGLRQDDPIVLVKSPYSGAGTQSAARWQISLTNSFPASGTNLVFDTLLRENDDHTQGDDWVEVQGSAVPLASGTTYYVSCMVRNSVPESSSWATGVSFTTETAAVLAATWIGAQ